MMHREKRLERAHAFASSAYHDSAWRILPLSDEDREHLRITMSADRPFFHKQTMSVQELEQCIAQDFVNSSTVMQLPDGRIVPAVPLPFSYGLFPWLWKRLTGWRDQYGRKAHLGWGREK